MTRQPPKLSQAPGLILIVTDSSDNGNGEPNPEGEVEITAAVYDGEPVNLDDLCGIKRQLEDLHKKLKDQTTKANGAVLMEITLPSNLIVDSTAMCPASCAQKDVKNYEVVLTWGGDSAFDQQQCMCVLHKTLFTTQWKISKINLPGARNAAKKDGERGDGTMECTEGEQFASSISGLKQKLETLDKALKELRKKADGAVHMKMPLSAMVVDSTDESGKQDVKNYEEVLTWDDGLDDLGQEQHTCLAACANQDIKNYGVVLTLGEGSNLGQKRRKCVLHDTLFGTNWKISKINLPEEVVPMESAKGEQSKGKEKA